MLTKLHYNTARKLYNEGHTTLLCPSNLSPIAFGGAFAYAITNKQDGATIGAGPVSRALTFKERCDIFRNYNATTSETGYTLTYWRR